MKTNILLRTLFRGLPGGGAPVALLIAAATLLAPAPQALARDVAIIIGVNKYSSDYMSGNDLDGCVADSENVESMLGNDPFHQWEVVRLTDDAASKDVIRAVLHYLAAPNPTGDDATLLVEKIVAPEKTTDATLIACESVSNLIEQATALGEGDNLFYYHSSHGGNYSDPNRTAVCLCTHDADYSEAEVATDFLRLGEGTKILAVVDTCHAGGLDPKLNFVPRPIFASVAPRLQETNVSLANIGFIAAAAYDDYSDEDENGGQFTSSFLKAIGTAGGDKNVDLNDDHQVSAFEAWNYTVSDSSVNSVPQIFNKALCEQFHFSGENLVVGHYMIDGSGSIVPGKTETYTLYAVYDTDRIEQVRDGVVWSATFDGASIEISANGELTCPAGAAVGGMIEIAATGPDASLAVDNSPYMAEVREAMTYAEALDNAIIEWAPEFGDSEWYGQYAVTTDGEDALESGFLPDGGASVFSGKVSGIGYLSFSYALEGSDGAELTVTVDGEEVVRASGTVDWTVATALVGPGDHVILFTHTRPAGDISEGRNRAWIDNVSFAQGRHLIDMDVNAQGWTTGGYGSEDVWQRGVPTFGPTDGRICWGTVPDGRYPDSVDAWLESPELAIRERTVLAFSTWFDIDNTAWKQNAASTEPDSPVGDEFVDGYKTFLDSGRVEISIANGGWINITSNAYLPGNAATGTIAGTSDGWIAAYVTLPAEAVGKTVRLRFRFTSDSYKQGLGNPAGWYIDDVSLFSYDDDAIALRKATVEDTAVGNANGIAEPGESVWVSFTAVNQGDTDRTGIAGSVRCATPGVTLPQSPAAVTYGDLAAGEAVDGAPRLLVAIADDVAPGTIVRLVQTITDDSGETWDAETSFLVQTAASWSGTVTECAAPGSSVASAGASVSLVSDFGVYTASTTSSGAFSFPAIPAGAYELTVSKAGFVDYGPVAVTVADGETLDVTLGVAYVVAYPASFHFDLAGTSSSESDFLWLGNGTTAKPGTVPATFSVLFPDGQPTWLEWDVTEGVIPAPEYADVIPEAALRFTVQGKGLLTDPRTSTTVRIMSNDCAGHAAQDFEITVDCAGVTDAIRYLSVIACDTYDDPAGTADADGYLEKGEDGYIWFTFRNEADVALSKLRVESAVVIDGSDGSDFANVVIDTSVDSHVGMRAYGTGVSSPALPITIPDTTELDPWYSIEVTLRDPETGLASVSTNIVTLYDRHSVSGTVYAANAHVGVMSNAVVTTTIYTAVEEGASLDFTIKKLSSGKVVITGLPDPDEGYPVREIIDPANPADFADFKYLSSNGNPLKIEPEIVVTTNMEALAAAFLENPELDLTEADPSILADILTVVTNSLTISEAFFRPTYNTNVVVTLMYKDGNGGWTVTGESTTYVNPEPIGNPVRYAIGLDDDENPILLPAHNSIGTDEEGNEVLYHVKVDEKAPKTDIILDLEPLAEALVSGVGSFELAETVSTDTNGTYVLHGLRNGYGKIYARPSEFTPGVATGYVVTNGVAVPEYSSEPALFANLPEGLPDFEAGEGLDFYLINTIDTASLRLLDITVTDANGDGVFEPGETFVVEGKIHNVGSLVAAETTLDFECLFPEGQDETTWPSATFPESPLALDGAIAPDMQATFSLADCVFGDMEGVATVLVKMTSVTGAGATNVTWGTFDLVCTDVTYSGTVYVDDEPFGGARLLFEVLDASGNALYTSVGTSLLPAGGASEGLGTYIFRLNDNFDHDVRIRVQPSGEFLSKGLVIDLPAPQNGVRAGLDFHLVGTGFDASGAPTGSETPAVTLADGSTDLAVTHPEGESTNLVLTIANNGDETMTVNGVSVRYVRSSAEFGQGVARRAMLSAAAPEEAESADDPVDFTDAVPGECFVTFRSGISAEEQEALLAPLGVTVATRYTIVRAVHCRFEATGNAQNAFLRVRAALLATGDVLKVEPVRTLHIDKSLVYRDGLVDDPRADAQWAIRNERQTGGSWGADIDVVPLWEKGLVGSRDVIVAVMDTGIDIDHPDLIPNLWVNPGEIPGNGIDDDGNGYIDDIHGWNFALDSSDVDDPINMKGCGHGTHCAGIIGAVGNNALGVVGVNHRVRLLAARISDDEGNLAATDANCARAFEYVLACGADVVNCSWGNPSLFSAPILTEAIQNVSKAGLLVCIAAANDAKDDDTYRLSISGLRATANVIVVAAADHDDKIASFSNFGDELVDIAAPGVDILSTMPREMGPLWIEEGIQPVGANYVHMNGTSMATPYVAGAAALLKAIAPASSMADVRKAILAGARRDPNLRGWVSTSGHLDVARAAEYLGSDWLVPTTDVAGGLAIAPGDTADIAFDVNPDLRLRAGEYGAIAEFSYTYGDEAAVFGAAVTDTVTPAPFAVVESVAIDDSASGDGDGYAEPGEAAGLLITLRNDGSLRLDNLTGTISGASGSWPLLASGGTAANADPIQVAMPAAEGDTEFTLELSGTAPDGSSVAFSLPVTVAVAFHASVVGTVRNSAGKGVAGAVVEFWTGDAGSIDTDALAGRVEADATGAYRIDGLPSDANVAVRAIPAGYARSDVASRAVSGGGSVTVNFTVASSDIWFPGMNPAGLEATLLPGASTDFTIVATNISTDAAAYRAVPIVRKRVLVLSDLDALNGLAPEIAKLGFDVDVLSNNYEFVNVNYGSYNFRNEEHVAYSKDLATYVNYDFVIADFDGDRQGGRQLTEEEETALREYLDLGGRVLVTGGSLLAMPDNDRLASVVGATELHRRTVDETSPLALAEVAQLPTWTLPGVDMDSFAEVSATQTLGAFLPSSNSESDVFETGPSATVYATYVPYFATDVSEHVDSPKIMRQAVGTGALYYWGGNSAAADIADRGVLQDILRDILYAELLEPVDWLTLSSTSGTLAGKRLTYAGVSVDASALAVGDYAASVVFFGSFADAETVAVPVTVHVALPAFTAYTTLGVTNAFGAFLKGDGQPGSCVFQLIATTDANGTVSAPRASDGMPSGGERVLASATSGLYYGRFGGTVVDQGLFNDSFDIPMTDDPLWVVVRAWSGPSVGGAIWYGDSAPYLLTRAEGESHDFGQWGVGTVFNWPAEDGTEPLDSNGDGIPDGYVLENFPGMDPTAPAEVENGIEFIKKIQADDTYYPYRVFATDRYVYALHGNGAQWGVSVWTTNGINGTLLGSFTPTGAAVLQEPRGMGRQPGANRIAIADTGHSTIHIFDFAESAIASGNVQGAFTYVRTIAGTDIPSADGGPLSAPQGVAMDAAGAVYVADTGIGNAVSSRRVVIFNADGSFRRAIQPTGDFELVSPAGIDVDPVTGDIYVANTVARNIVRISETGEANAVYDGTFDGEGSLAGPTDVKVWRVGDTFRLLIADRDANAVCVLDSDGRRVATFANPADATIYVLDGKFRLPWGVYPINDSDEAWVADTRNNRLQHLRFTLDGDGDGIDDTQEMLNGLDPIMPNEFDTDGDGLSDSAEILLGTNPIEPDTDDGGVNDGDEVNAGLNPLDASDDTSPMTLTVEALPAEGGAVSGSGTYAIGTDVEITATPAEGWLFAGWQDDGSTVTPRSVTVAANGNAYTALFERESHLIVVNFVTTNDAPSDIVSGGTQTHTSYYGISFLQDDTVLFVPPYAFLEGSDTQSKTYVEPIIEFANGATENVTVTYVVDGGAEAPEVPVEAPSITATAIAVNGTTLTASFTTDATNEAQYGIYMNDARTSTVLIVAESLQDLSAYRAWRVANPNADRSACPAAIYEISATVTATDATAPFTFSITADLTTWAASHDSLFIIGFDKP